LLCLSPITIAGIQQTVAEALLGLIQEEGTANELIVGLESLSIGNLANDNSLEDPVAEDCAMFDGNAVKNDLVASNARDGNRVGGDASLNDLQQMGRVLHRFDLFESFFDDFVGDIDWGGEDYDGDEGLLEEIADSAE
jgi:hypothetical protein